MKIKPLYDNIVVDVKEQKETTKSGFILPSASAEKYVTAKALEVGCGEDGKMLVKAGDYILFPANAVIKAKVDGDEISIIRQSDVLAVIE